MREIGQAAFNELLNLGVCSADGTLIASVGTLEQLSIGQLSLVHQAVFQAARKAAADATARLAVLEAEKQIAEKAWRTLTIKRLAAASLDIGNVGLKALRYAVNPASAATSTAGLIASKCWGGSGSYNADAMNKGMRENILSNIHQVGLVGGGYVITTPQKNLVYHTYIKSVGNDVEDAVIYAGFDNDNNSNTSNRTMTFLPATFQNKTSLKTVRFHDISGQSSNTGMAFLFTIPDEAFKGCTALTEFSTLLATDDNGTRALGPENFILAGDSIFAGRKCKAEVDSLTAIGKGAGLVPFHIVIDPLRKDDYLTIQGGLHTAGLAGSVSGTGNVITDCRVSAQITTFPENGMMVVGGFVGNGSNLTVEGCLFDGELKTQTSQDFCYGGAIVGWSPETSAGVTVKNCIENGTYSGITHAGFNYAANQSAS